MERLFDEIKQASPMSRIVICSLIPRPVDFDQSEAKVCLINLALKHSCRQRNLLFLNMYKMFMSGTTPDLSLYRHRYPGGRIDKIHPNECGLTKIRQKSRQILGQIVQRIK